MAVRFAQPYRFSEQQLARMVETGLVPEWGTKLLDGIPYRAGSPVRFSNDDYQRLGESGIITADERVELIDGEVIRMTSIGGPHQQVVYDLDDYLATLVGPELRIAHGAIKLRGTEPVPDISILRRADEVRNTLATTDACVLVIEVSDKTVRYDRSIKRERYARGGVPEYWVVDLKKRSVVLHLQPVAGDYQQVSEHPRGSEFVSPGLGGQRVFVDEVLR